MIELVAEHGYEGVTVRGLSRLAGVSTRTFYKHFPNTDACFASTYESLMQQGLRRAHAAQQGAASWEEALRASLQSLMDDIASYPKAAQLVLVEAFAVGSPMQSPMREAIAGFERLLCDSLLADPAARTPSRHIAGAVAAGVMRVARQRLLARESAQPSSNELIEWVIALLGRYPAPTQRPTGMPLSFGAKLQSGAEEELASDIRGAFADEERRILSATVKLGATGGFSTLTIPKVRIEAGVSRRSFDARFSNLGECFLDAIEAMALGAAARAGVKGSGTESWEGGVHRTIAALCAEIARKPRLARLAFVDIFAPGRGGLERRERLVSLGASRLRGAAPPQRGPSELVAEASVAAVWRIAHTAILTGREMELPRLAPLLNFVLLART
jgi:AcrR family transcriptional regulator